MAFPLRFLSICPRVCKHGRRLVASTAWRLRLLTLGMLYRRVVVDPKNEVVLVQRRYLWLLARRRRIPFRFVKAVTYGYQDLAVGEPWTSAHDSYDLFRVGLRLHNQEEVHLFFFYSDGTFTNDGPLPDWLYWEDYVFDLCGTQEKESRVFVELLGKNDRRAGRAARTLKRAESLSTMKIGQRGDTPFCFLSSSYNEDRTRPRAL